MTVNKRGGGVGLKFFSFLEKILGSCMCATLLFANELIIVRVKDEQTRDVFVVSIADNKIADATSVSVHFASSRTCYGQDPNENNLNNTQ